MSTILTASEVENLREAGQKLVKVFATVKPYVKAGANLLDLEKVIAQAITDQGGKPAFKGYESYPAVSCISVEEQVVHCVPVDRVLKEGEIVSIDIGLAIDGINTDAAVTWPVGEVSPDHRRLLRDTYRALQEGTSHVRAGVRVDEISASIEASLKRSGLTIFKQFVGHGIGYDLHEDPYIPNFSSGVPGPSLRDGQAVAIEPITGLGDDQVITSGDGWSVTTSDGRPAAHFEHTVLVSGSGFEVITPLESLIGSDETLDSGEER